MTTSKLIAYKKTLPKPIVFNPLDILMLTEIEDIDLTKASPRAGGSADSDNQPTNKNETMKLTKDILEQATELAKKHIESVKTNAKDGQWESDPYDHWDHIDGFDVNFVGSPIPDADGDDTDEYTWRCAIYSGEYDSTGYWRTNYQDYVPFYIVGQKPVKFMALTIDKINGKTHWTPTFNGLDDLLAHFKRYPANGKDVIVHWLDDFDCHNNRTAEEQLTRTCIEL